MAQVILYHNLYVHSTFSNFIRTIADIFSTEWFSRTKDVVISTYEKSVERERNRKNDASEKYSPKFPYITLNFDLDMAPDEILGKQFYQFGGYCDYFSTKQWAPYIYQDDNTILSTNFNRYKGNIELIIWCSSIYELLDYKMLVFQKWGGLNRIFQPYVEGYFVLPDEIKLYTYENPYTGESFKLDWDKSLTQEYLIRTINQNKLVYPFGMNPMLKLISVDDGSEKYGNPSKDEISIYRMSIMIEWESWLPVNLVLLSDALPIPCHTFQLDLNVNYQWSGASSQLAEGSNPLTTPIHKLVTWWDQDSTSLGTAQLMWDRNYVYFLTAEDEATLRDEKNIYITLPVELDDCVYLNIFTRYGELTRDFCWQLSSESIVKLIGLNMTAFREGDIISFEIYRIG